MWTSVKHGFAVVVKNIPIGIGMGIGVAIGTRILEGVANGASYSADAIRKATKSKVAEVAATTPAAQGFHPSQPNG